MSKHYYASIVTGPAAGHGVARFESKALLAQWLRDEPEYRAARADSPGVKAAIASAQEYGPGHALTADIDSNGYCRVIEARVYIIG